MELSQVRYFVTLCRTLNFTRAAEACNVTQPALTRAIQKLEDELGGALLFRERTLTQLTELGRAMRPHLEAMLEAADAAHALAKARRGGGGSSLKIGLGPGIGAASIADILREIADMLPDLAVRFEDAGPAMLIEAMLGDMLDCALLPADCDLPDRLNRWPLFEDHAVVVLPAGHRLCARQDICAADLIDEIILVGERCGGFGARLSAETGRAYRQRACAGSWPQMLDLVAAGLGVALLSERLRLPPPLEQRPMTEPALKRRILLAAVAGRPQNAAVSCFVKLCRARGFS